MSRTIRGLCKCGRPQRTKGYGSSGIKLWDRQCWKCKEGGYRLHKKDHCEKCGFVAEHSVQLDVDHIDGNHHNDEPDNLMTLCANCHRLKTQLSKDWLPTNRNTIVVHNYGQLELTLDDDA